MLDKSREIQKLYHGTTLDNMKGIMNAKQLVPLGMEEVVYLSYSKVEAAIHTAINKPMAEKIVVIEIDASYLDQSVLKIRNEQTKFCKEPTFLYPYEISKDCFKAYFHYPNTFKMQREQKVIMKEHANLQKEKRSFIQYEKNKLMELETKRKELEEREQLLLLELELKKKEQEIRRLERELAKNAEEDAGK